MRSLLDLFILLFISLAPNWAHIIEAVNEESGLHRQFQLNQGVECLVNSSNRPVVSAQLLQQKFYLDTSGLKGNSPPYQNLFMVRLLASRLHIPLKLQLKRRVNMKLFTKEQFTKLLNSGSPEQRGKYHTPIVNTDTKSSPSNTRYLSSPTLTITYNTYSLRSFIDLNFYIRIVTFHQ